MIERWWVELNVRVSYPIKYALIDLEHRELANRSIPYHLFSIGFIVRQVAHYGLTLTAGAWNSHIIPGMCHIILHYMCG